MHPIRNFALRSYSFVRKILCVCLFLTSLFSSAKGQLRRQTSPGQKIPIVLGGKGNLYYELKKSEISYGISGEIVFPVIPQFALRTDFLELRVIAAKKNLFYFNSALTLNGLFFIPANYAFTPYGLFGLGFTTMNGQKDYQLGLGLGGNLLLNPNRASVKLFSEIGVTLEGNNTTSTTLKISGGVRFDLTAIR